MDVGISHTVGRILGSSRATAEERAVVVEALKTANTWSALPRAVQNLLNRLKREAIRPPTLPGGNRDG